MTNANKFEPDYKVIYVTRVVYGDFKKFLFEFQFSIFVIFLFFSVTVRFFFLSILCVFVSMLVVPVLRGDKMSAAISN